MRVFVYGTLLDPEVLARRAGTPGLGARMVPAMLAGFRRVRMGTTPWPTLRRDPAHIVPGAVINVGLDAFRRLSAYEGPRYRLSPVAVATPLGQTRARKIRAFAWLAPGGTRHAWGEIR